MVVRTTAIPSISIFLGGKERRLRYTFKVWSRFEEKTGEQFLMTFNRMATAPDLLGASSITALIWCGLIHEDPELDIDDVADWLTINTLEELVPAIVEAASGKTRKQLDKAIEDAAKQAGGKDDPTEASPETMKNSDS